ncbi:hypothetical protein ACFO5O_08620 [Geojedonia litorea]|uniref:Uncharacterized protein n=1 Tax=Geojedonia litorea TaxID=1268269 RepID=A0ABV9N695_9FLAO
MKKQILIMTLFVFIGFACSNDESVVTEEINLNHDIELAAQEIIESKTFKTRLNQARSTANNERTSSNNGNGIYIVKKGVFSFFPFFYDTGFIVFGVLFEESHIKIFPNGTAEYSLDVEDPWALWIDDNVGEFDNSCLRPTGSKFTVKYRGQVEIVEQPWGTEYHIKPPFESVINIKARNFRLNDADTYDPVNDISYCREDGVTEKTINMTYIGKVNNENDDSSNLLNITVN